MFSVKNLSHLRLKKQWQIKLDDYVTAIAWSDNGQYLAASSAAGEINLWSGAQKQCLINIQHSQAISCLGFSADSRYFAAAGQAGEVLIWNLDNIAISPITLSYQGTWIEQLAWHPQLNLLAFTADNYIHIWSGELQSVERTIDFCESSVFDLAWHPQGTFLAACGHTGTKVWNTQIWEKEPSLLAVPGASLAAAWSDDGQYLAAGNYDRTLSVLAWGNPPPWLMQGFPGKVRKVVWCQGKKCKEPLALVAACLEGITIWQYSAQQKNWESRVLEQHQDFVNSLAFYPAHNVLASTGNDGQVCLWYKQEKLIQKLLVSKLGCSCLAWHPRDYFLVIGGQEGSIWGMAGKL